MSHLTPREKLTVVLTLLVAITPLLFGAFYIHQKHRWAQERMDELAPRYARLLGLEGAQERLTQIEAEAGRLLLQYTYPAAQDVAQTGNDAQQRVRSIFTNAGLEIVSSQVLPAKAEKYFDRISLVVRLEGNLPSLQSAMTVLSEQSPAIIVDGFTVQTIGSVKAETLQRLGIQFNLTVLRQRS